VRLAGGQTRAALGDCVLCAAQLGLERADELAARGGDCVGFGRAVQDHHCQWDGYLHGNTVGDAVFRSGSWYRCTVAHINQGPPNATFWATTPLRSPAWDSGRQYAIDDVALYGGVWYRCLAAHNGLNPSLNAATWSAATNAATNWNSTTAYTTASRVTYGNVWYRCILAHTNIAPGNATYWTAMGAPVIYAEGTANLIRDGKTQLLRNIIETGVREGMCLMENSVMDLLKDRKISPDTARANIANRQLRAKI
jgi:hypothetical protein